MSTRTDLNGMMRADEDNLTLRMSDFFTKCAGRTAVVNVRYTPIGGTAPEKLNGDPILAESPKAGAVENVIEQVERVVIEKLGGAPAGVLRVQGYAKGEAGRLLLDMQRTLVPADLSGLGDPNLTLVRGLLDLKTRENATLVNALVAAFGASQQTIAAQSQAIAQLATVRTAATASSDMQGITTILALGLIVVFAPRIKQALGVKPSASLEETIEALRRAVTASGPEHLSDALANPPQPPPRALEDGAAAGGEAGGEAGAGEGAAELEQARAFLKRLEADPKLRERVFTEAMAIPKIKEAATAAYMATLG